MNENIVMAGTSKRLEAVVAQRRIVWKICGSYPAQRRHLPICATVLLNSQGFIIIVAFCHAWNEGASLNIGPRQLNGFPFLTPNTQEYTGSINIHQDIAVASTTHNRLLTPILHIQYDQHTIDPRADGALHYEPRTLTQPSRTLENTEKGICTFWRHMSSRSLGLRQGLHLHAQSLSSRVEQGVRTAKSDEDIEYSAMQVSPEQGQFMALLVSTQVRKAIEVGTYTDICVVRSPSATRRWDTHRMRHIRKVDSRRPNILGAGWCCRQNRPASHRPSIHYRTARRGRNL